MVFTNIDKKTMQTLCTLVKYAGPVNANKDEIVHVGQELGVPKEDTLELLNEWEEEDTVEFTTEEEKKRFIQSCFPFMTKDYHPDQSEMKLYHHVVSNLGLKTSSIN